MALLRRLTVASGALAASLAVLVVPVAPTTAGSGPTITLPTANAKWDYQIGKAYRPPHGVTVVSRDREARPFSKGYTFCYVNAYQTQPNEIRWWKNHHNGLLLKKDGKYVVDGYWGETLLDTSTKAKRAKLAKIIGRWIAGCAADGFQAVEPDNLDSWTRSKGQLTRDDNFTYAQLLIAKAHAEGLAIGQKNAAGSTARGAKIGFDFAVAEECGRWHECKAYTSAYGNQVYVIEYRLQDFKYSCNHWGSKLSIVLRNRMVTAPGSKKYVYKAC